MNAEGTTSARPSAIGTTDAGEIRSTRPWVTRERPSLTAPPNEWTGVGTSATSRMIAARRGTERNLESFHSGGPWNSSIQR